MGTRLITFDDLDGSAPAETVSFALYGVDYELDLSAENRRALEDALGPFIAAATTRTTGEPLAALALEIEAPSHAGELEGTDVQVDLDTSAELAEVTAQAASTAAARQVRDSGEPETAVVVLIDQTPPEPATALIPAVSGDPAVDSALVRSWAHENGLYIGARGPITASVLAEYIAAQQLPAQTTVRTGSRSRSGGVKKPKAKKALKAKAAKVEPSREKTVKVTPPSQSKSVRAWAARHDLQINSTGPLPKSVTDAFAEAIQETGKRNKGRIYPPDLRPWAREQGYKVGNGKIGDEIIAAYTAAH